MATLSGFWMFFIFAPYQRRRQQQQQKESIKPLHKRDTACRFCLHCHAYAASLICIYLYLSKLVKQQQWTRNNKNRETERAARRDGERETDDNNIYIEFAQLHTCMNFPLFSCATTIQLFVQRHICFCIYRSAIDSFISPISNIKLCCCRFFYWSCVQCTCTQAYVHMCAVIRGMMSSTNEWMSIRLRAFTDNLCLIIIYNGSTHTVADRRNL